MGTWTQLRAFPMIFPSCGSVPNWKHRWHAATVPSVLRGSFVAQHGHCTGEHTTQGMLQNPAPNHFTSCSGSLMVLTTLWVMPVRCYDADIQYLGFKPCKIGGGSSPETPSQSWTLHPRTALQSSHISKSPLTGKDLGEYQLPIFFSAGNYLMFL